MVGFIILAILVIIIVTIIGMYNGLVQSRIKVDNAWSQIDVQRCRPSPYREICNRTARAAKLPDRRTCATLSILRLPLFRYIFYLVQIFPPDSKARKSSFFFLRETPWVCRVHPKNFLKPSFPCAFLR